jgi:hypothetical protein
MLHQQHGNQYEKRIQQLETLNFEHQDTIQAQKEMIASLQTSISEKEDYIRVLQEQAQPPTEVSFIF